jgi:hypothetical protein
MYDLAEHKKPTGDPWRWEVRDEDGNTVARVRVREDALEIVAALNLVEFLRERFPGLRDGETEMNGGDVVESLGCLKFGEDGRYRWDPW